jgi:hypothetical protein
VHRSIDFSARSFRRARIWSAALSVKGDSLGGFEVLVLDPAPAPTGGST